MALISGSPFGYFDPLQLSQGKSEAEMNQLRERGGRAGMGPGFVDRAWDGSRRRRGRRAECPWHSNAATIIERGLRLFESGRPRRYELKHGRVAMAAVFGIIVEPWFHPLAKSCHVAHPTDPILSGVELNFAGKAQILGFCAGVEALNYYIKKGDKYKPGDLLGAAYYVADEEDELWVSYQEKELNNGAASARRSSFSTIRGDAVDASRIVRAAATRIVRAAAPRRWRGSRARPGQPAHNVVEH